MSADRPVPGDPAVAKRGPRTGRPSHPSGPAVRRLSCQCYDVLGIGDDASPVFTTRRGADRWLAERLAALPRSRRPGQRACLCCGAKFLSVGTYNRLCDRCRGRDPGPVAMAVVRPARRGEGRRA